MGREEKQLLVTGASGNLILHTPFRPALSFSATQTSTGASLTANGTFRTHVNVRPQRIERADFEHGQIKRAEFLADVAETVPLTGIRTIEDTMLRA